MGDPVSWVMKVSKNGQVSIPASVRARWQTEAVMVVDLGDRIVLAPKLKDPFTELRGKYAGRGGPTTDDMRREDREADAARDKRTYGR